MGTPRAAHSRRRKDFNAISVRRADVAWRSRCRSPLAILPPDWSMTATARAGLFSCTHCGMRPDSAASAAPPHRQPEARSGRGAGIRAPRPARVSASPDHAVPAHRPPPRLRPPARRRCRAAPVRSCPTRASARPRSKQQALSTPPPSPPPRPQPRIRRPRRRRSPRRRPAARLAPPPPRAGLGRMVRGGRRRRQRALEREPPQAISSNRSHSRSACCMTWVENGTGAAPRHRSDDEILPAPAGWTGSRPRTARPE